MSEQNRVKELLSKKRVFQQKITDINNWLLKNFDHPDRAKYFNDKAFYGYEINLIDKKIYNLNVGLPEHGYASPNEQNNLNGKTTKNII